MGKTMLRYLATLETEIFEDSEGVKVVVPNLVIPHIPSISWAELNMLTDKNAKIGTNFSYIAALSSLKELRSNYTKWSFLPKGL